MQFDSEIFHKIKNSVDEILKTRGKVNIIIAGKTGVGKSTLINAVFQGNLANTGSGHPVTQNTREITKEGVPISIFDTRGLEVAKYKETVNELEMLVKERSKETEPKRHIHIAWICLSEDSRRVEEAEKDLVNRLCIDIPVIVVITKARADNNFSSQVKEILPKACNVIRVRSIEEVDDEGNMLKPRGLDNLIDATNNLIPEAHKTAFVAAQKINLDLKVKRSHAVVAAAAVAAGAAGAIPVPFSDAIAIIPIQIGMLAGISAAFGLELNEGFLSTLVSGTFTGLIGTVGGRALVGELIKLIPGLGSLTGGLISGGVAATVTTTFGEAYIGTLYAMFKDSPDYQPSTDEIVKAFKEKLSSKKN